MKAKFTLWIGIGLIFLIFGQAAEAQILQTKSEVMEIYGTPFYSGTTEKGENYLYYKIPMKTKTSGTYDQGRVLFFEKDEKGIEYCYRFKILEPSSETIYNITAFNRDLVQTGESEWKDFAKGIIYQLKEDNGVCKIQARYDNEVGLVRVYKF